MGQEWKGLCISSMSSRKATGSGPGANMDSKSHMQSKCPNTRTISCPDKYKKTKNKTKQEKTT
jgi:hypothetical protein